jgi:hypothetical protein
MEFRTINTPAEITEDVVEAIETAYEGWFADEVRINWSDLLDRVELLAQVNLGSDMDSAVIKQVKKIVKTLRSM